MIFQIIMKVTQETMGTTTGIIIHKETTGMTTTTMTPIKMELETTHIKLVEVEEVKITSHLVIS